MRKLTIMIIPDGVQHSTRQFRVPRALFKAVGLAALASCAVVGFFVLDYIQLRSLRANYQQLNNENVGLKGEARILMQNLEEVKRSLRRVQDYSSKLGELTTLKLQKVSKETGIGPLTPEEYHSSNQQDASRSETLPADYIPLGVNMDNLTFRPVFDRLATIGSEANKQAMEMQHLLSTLSQQKSLLQSIPLYSPVDGWVTSGFGTRISPFTGEKTAHQGIDVAAPVGTPIYAPAEGVVIFSGAKAGFGNFIMIAHAYGVVTRYGHNHQNLVHPGQKVERGEQIATVGMSGRTTGPHLHYEVWVNGKVDNPQKFVLNMQELGSF